MGATMSARQYAKHRGVSHSSVNAAVRTGRIPTENGKIDARVADRAWAENTDQSKPRNSVTGSAARSPTQATNVPNGKAGAFAPDKPIAQSGAAAASSYSTSRAVRESYLARLAKLEFEEKSGRLVSADEVRITTFNVARNARNMLLGLPDRLAPLLAAMTSAREVHALLTVELRRVCDEVSRAGDR